ncbi:hypothetical protein RRG08_008192 [Elysia crispata]|uniref:Uncharacterized protein n=1 Tax=Elysia crispata TaxID=231223 RepID=A0AAE1A7Y2_9GAST|nr:hypothetical protein RRG08_008192 [Elysia crispata]
MESLHDTESQVCPILVVRQLGNHPLIARCGDGKKKILVSFKDKKNEGKKKRRQYYKEICSQRYRVNLSTQRSRSAPTKPLIDDVITNITCHGPIGIIFLQVPIDYKRAEGRGRRQSVQHDMPGLKASCLERAFGPEFDLTYSDIDNSFHFAPLLQTIVVDGVRLGRGMSVKGGLLPYTVRNNGQAKSPRYIYEARSKLPCSPTPKTRLSLMP